MKKTHRPLDSAMILILSLIVSSSIIEGSSDSNRCPQNLPSTSKMALFENTCYQFVSEEKFWHQARDHCLGNRGRLVKIDDPQTNEFIVAQLNGLWWRNNGVWIGLHDIPSESRWEWTGSALHLNEPVRWTNWGRGHPGAFLANLRDCVRMVRNDGWKWHETVCRALRWKYRFICEYNATNPMTDRNDRRRGDQRSTIGPLAESLVQTDDKKALNVFGNKKSVVLFVVVVIVLTGALVFLGLFMFYRSRRRRQNSEREYSAENCVGSKVKKFSDELTEASSFRPTAISNIYVSADVTGHVTSRLAPEPMVDASEFQSRDEK